MPPQKSIAVFVAARAFHSYRKVSHELAQIAYALVYEGCVPEVMCRARHDEAVLTAAFLRAFLEHEWYAVHARELDCPICYNGRLDAGVSGAVTMAPAAGRWVTTVLSLHEVALIVTNASLSAQVLRNMYGPNKLPDSFGKELKHFESSQSGYLVVPMRGYLEGTEWKLVPACT